MEYTMDSPFMESGDCKDVIDIVDVRNLPNYISGIDARIDNGYDVTSLGNLILLAGQASADDDKEDESTELNRLSLAYEGLSKMPKIIIDEMGLNVKILDISNNHFSNLEFLQEFKELTHLICDRNDITSQTYVPYLPKLELLWLNHCKIKELYPWIKGLQSSCPNLKYLSLMGNPAAPSIFNGGNFYEYLQYRYYIISLFPKLVHLDDKAVTSDQRKEAEKLYTQAVIDRLIYQTHTNLTGYVRGVSEKVSSFILAGPSSGESDKSD